MEREITMQEILEAINDLSTKTDARFTQFRDELMGEIVSLRSEMNERFTRVDERLSYHETWLKRLDHKIEGCATKQQVSRLTAVLEDRQVISKYDAAYVNSLR